MKKAMIVMVLAMAIFTVALSGIEPVTQTTECAACGTWYTCDPPRCSQTVTYWDSWRECNAYANSKGYPGCACYGQDLR